MQRQLLGIAVTSCLLSYCGPDSRAGSPMPESMKQLAAQAFEAMNAKFDGLSSLQYRVERTTVSKGVKLVEKWTFLSSSDGVLRIDYRAPEHRIFMANNETFIEYLPAVRKAQKTRLSPQNRQGHERVAAVLQRLTVDGLRMGDYQELLNHLSAVQVSSNAPAILTVEGSGPRYRIQIDTQREVLLSFEKWDGQGRLEQSIQASGF